MDRNQLPPYNLFDIPRKLMRLAYTPIGIVYSFGLLLHLNKPFRPCWKISEKLYEKFTYLIQKILGGSIVFRITDIPLFCVIFFKV